MHVFGFGLVIAADRVRSLEQRLTDLAFRYRHVRADLHDPDLIVRGNRPAHRMLQHVGAIAVSCEHDHAFGHAEDVEDRRTGGAAHPCGIARGDESTTRFLVWAGTLPCGQEDRKNATRHAEPRGPVLAHQALQAGIVQAAADGDLCAAEQERAEKAAHVQAATARML
ncbi:hypothetical protein G6F68_016952 [Rhizopus microsporus]|nr:hypothetical protein G6F68_016952 [Rhizopus microsporus]